MTESSVPAKWESWCTTGRHGRGTRKRNAVLKCLKSGQVRGYFSDMVLNPDLDPTDSMYPSLEHLVDRDNHTETVVEARIFNDMKSHLSEGEFWKAVSHLFGVGCEKGKITSRYAERLPEKWSPAKHYKKVEAKPAPALHSSPAAGSESDEARR